MNRVLYFSTPTCAPCKGYLPRVVSYLNNNPGQWELVRVDCTVDVELATQYGISSVPTLVLLRNEVEVGRVVGTTHDPKTFLS